MALGPNLLSAEDANFEGGTVGGWTNFQNCASVVNSTSQARSGSHSLSFTSYASSDATVQLSVPVTAGAVYQVSGWLRAGTASRNGTFWVFWYDANNNQVGQSGNVTFTTSLTSWQQASGQVTAPAGATRAILLPTVTAGAAGELVYLDDITFAQPVTTGPNLLGVEDATFEGGTTGAWDPQTSCTAANTTAQAHSGTRAISLTQTSGGGLYVAQNSIPVKAGQTYYASAWFRPFSQPRLTYIMWYWFDSTGAEIGGISQSTGVMELSGGWTQATVILSAPANAASIQLLTYVAAGGTVGEVHYIDDVILQVAAPPVPAVPGNLLAGDNANFEGGSVGDWGGQNATLANTELQSHSGGRSLLATTTGASGGSVALGTAPLPIGAKYAYSGWALPSMPMACGFQLAYFDANYNKLGSGEAHGVAVSPGGWTQLKVVAVVPAGTVNTIIYGSIETGANGLQCFWDDFALVQVIPATMSMLPSGGAAGALITITGTDLDLVQAITVGPNPGTAIKADVQSQSATTLTFLIPHGLPASTSYAYLSYVGGTISAGALSVLTPSRPCTRTAWLTLGTLSVPLEDATQGYLCTDLDLGFPVVREVMADRPDQNGADDRTTLLGARNITAAITALAGAGAQVDAVASSFAPFMVPSARPVLHYILDRPGAAERVMTLRASGYSWPIIGPYQRDIQLQWVCADPDAKDPNAHTVAAFAGSSVSPGRVYRRAYPLTYPVGGNSPTTGLMAPVGDLPVRPRLLIYGPVTAPVVTVSPAGAGQPSTARIAFLPYFTVGAGHYVEVDCYAKTARLDGDPAQPAVTALDWQGSTWPVVNPVPPAAAGCYLQLGGSSTSSISQVQAIWNDRYLT